MNPVRLAQEIEERYRRYLETTFYLKDPDLRKSFQEALRSGRLSKGPFLEATPIFKRGAPPRILFPDILGFEPHNDFLAAGKATDRSTVTRRRLSGVSVTTATLW